MLRWTNRQTRHKRWRWRPTSRTLWEYCQRTWRRQRQVCHLVTEEQRWLVRPHRSLGRNLSRGSTHNTRVYNSSGVLVNRSVQLDNSEMIKMDLFHYVVSTQQSIYLSDLQQCPTTYFYISELAKPPGMQPGHRVWSQHIWCLSHARINWEGCARKGIWRKNVGMAEMGAPISLDGMAVHPDCSCVCLCYLHFASEKPEDGEMYLMAPEFSRTKSREL